MGTFERKEICFGIEEIEEEKQTEVKYFVVGSNKNLKIENEFNKHVYSYIRDCIVVQIAKKYDIIESYKNYIIENLRKNI